MNEELKACPLCGGDELSHGYEAPGVDGSPFTGTVQCHSCNLLVWAETEAEAIAAWNRRASPPLDLAGEAVAYDVHAAMERAIRNAVMDGADTNDVSLHWLAYNYLEQHLPPLYAHPPAAEPVGLRERVILSKEIVAFLMGEADYNGTWFGDLDDGLPGRFWWRGILATARRESAALTTPARTEAVREALEQSRQGWENVIEFGLLPAQHRPTARELSDKCSVALAALQPKEAGNA